MVLDPDAPDPRAARGSTKGIDGPPIKAAKSKFIWHVVAGNAIVSTWSITKSTKAKGARKPFRAPTHLVLANRTCWRTSVA
jgi:hypothetical protein